LLTLLAEGFLAVGFWSERLRPLAWAVGLGLHLGAVALVQEGRMGVLIFGVAMVGLYASFGGAFGHRDDGAAGQRGVG
jgi:hypothetical protein